MWVRMHTENPVNIFQRWGKAAQTEQCHLLPFHMLDVAAVLDVGLERRPRLLTTLAEGLALDRDATRAMLLTILALHDIGKVAASFQALNPAAAQRIGVPLTNRESYAHRHDVLGQTLLTARLPLCVGEAGLPNALADWPGLSLLVSVATGHHGRPPHAIPGLWTLKRLGCLTEADVAVADGLIVAIAGLFGWREQIPDLKGLQRLSPQLNGLFTLCDWLGSSERFRYREDAGDLATYLATARKAAAEVLDDVRPALFRELPSRPPASFASLFPHLSRDGEPPEPSPLQALVDRLFTDDALPDGPLLVVIEDLPGSGKTEAGDLIVQRLVSLDRANGAYFGLPTMVTADAAFARKFDAADGLSFGADLFLETPQIILAHSRRHHNPTFREVPTRSGVEEGEGHAVAWFGHSSRRSLLSDLGVGTIDQALAGALRGRHATVRLAGLWRKVLLVDEVHAYDDYMRALLESLLRWEGLMGEPVVLMSATLPSAARGALIRAYAEGAGWSGVADMADRTKPGAYPLLTLVSQQGVAQHPVAPKPGPGTRPVRFEAMHDVETVEARIGAWLASGRNVLWFRNTVDDAVESWERLSGFEPLLYHARFLPGDRSERERQLLGTIGKSASPEARRGRLVIATQAAEQSLDLDADELVTDLAPADSVVQRLGRRRRHARDPSGALLERGDDQRPDSPVILLTPPLAPPCARWYARAFPRAAAIYDNDARLWLSALYLLHPDRIPGRGTADDRLILSRDLRPMLEAVYADTPVGVAPSLLERHLAASGSDLEERHQGLLARLPFRNGLLEDWGNAAESPNATDGEPRTRLIDSHTVILAVVDDGVPRLLGRNADGKGTVEASECRSPMRLGSLASEKPWVKALRATLDEKEARQLKDDQLVFLTHQESDIWQSAPRPDWNAWPLRYCSKRGFGPLRT